MDELTKSILLAPSLEQLAPHFGFVYTPDYRHAPEEQSGLGAISLEYYEIARDEPERYRNFLARLDYFLRESDVSRDEIRMLDMGCGVGALTCKVAEEYTGANITGMDISEGMIRASERFARQSPARNRLEFRQGSVYDIQNEFDVVFSRHMVHRLEYPSVALRKMLSSTRQGGLLYVTAFFGDLDNERARRYLVEMVKRQVRKGRMNFAKYYLSAVLRAPRKEFYEAVKKELEGGTRASSLEFTGYDAEIAIIP